MPDNTFTRKIAALILITFIIRCYLATLLELGVDASYYYTYALQPDWNHFDHPPLLGIFIRIFTLDLNWVNDLSMRLPSIVSAAICTWLIFKCGVMLKNERTGWIAAILYNTSTYTSIASGLFILPDSPQLVFWLLAVYLSFQLLLIPSPKKIENTRLLLLGVVIGVATMCKVHGVFLWLGIGMYILIYDRKYLINPFLYLSVLLTLILISPIYFWNLQNDFVTWNFHSDRVVIHDAGIHVRNFLQTLFDSFFYFSPFNIVLYVLALFHLRNSTFPKKTLQLLLWLAFPIILATLFISFFRTVLVHWSGPGHIALMIISGYIVDEHMDKPKNVYKNWIRATVIGMCVFVVCALWATNHYPGTLGKSNLPELGRGDESLERYGWNVLRDQFNTIRQNEIQAGKMDESSPIVISWWNTGGHYLYYVGRPLDIPVIGVGPVNKIHKFAWLNRRQGYVEKGTNAFFISTSNNLKDPYELFSSDFKNIVFLDRIPLKRSGKIARYWYIYRLEDAVRKLGNVWPAP